MENIMLQDARKEQIKIVDFGLSNIYTGDNPLKTHCGSPEYAAPELFVVGKKYGPEVDLWSLGVVFYAMATGRLPFQSPRDGQTSSEERRRQLLVQINRGLTAAQKKSISSMSSEYRNLINRLLMPVAHKRITIQELCFHPWIGNDGKNPTKTSHGELVAMEHNAIIDEIAEAKSTARTTIERDILQSKYGEIGGMYNIKAHVMRRAGSLRAFQARSWTTATSNLQTKRAQTAGILRSSLYQSRVSPTTSSTRTENSGQQSTSVQRRMIFQKSLPASKPSSFSGGDKGVTWTSKETGTTSSSFTCHRPSCPVHSEKSASGSTTTPGIHGSVRHANKWENNTNRMHAHVITRTNNKSIEGLFDRPVTQRLTRSVEPREIRSYSNNLRSEVAPHRDPIKQWIAEKQTTLEKRDQSFPRQQSSQYRTSTSFQDSIARYRPSTAAPAIRTPSGVTDQSADRANKNQTPERRFYRSPAATRPEVRKTRLVLSNGTRMVERNFFSSSSRPFTANESSKLLPTPKGTKSPNKCEVQRLPSVATIQTTTNGLRGRGRASLPYNDVYRKSPGTKTCSKVPSGIDTADRLRDRLRKVRTDLQAKTQQEADLHDDYKKKQKPSRERHKVI